jgi:AAA domain-containing protein
VRKVITGVPTSPVLKDADQAGLDLVRQLTKPLSEFRKSHPEFLKPADATADDRPPIADAIRASIFSGQSLQKIDLPERRRLIGDWFLEADYGIIFGSRGLGKSWIALGLATALATKGTFGPYQSEVEFPVLYVDGEMLLSAVRERVLALKGSCPENLYLLNHEVLFREGQRTVNLANSDTQEAILSVCLESGIKVVFFDNLSCLASGVAENDSDAWEPIKIFFLKLRRHQIAVVLVHHAGRSGKDLRGTSRREDDVFWIVRLNEPADIKDANAAGARFTTTFTKNRNAPRDPLSYDWRIEPQSDGSVKVAATETSSDDVIIEWVRVGVDSAKDIASEMGVSPGTISKRAKKLIDAGRLQKSGRCYTLGSPEE